MGQERGLGLGLDKLWLWPGAFDLQSRAACPGQAPAPGSALWLEHRAGGRSWSPAPREVCPGPTTPAAAGGLAGLSEQPAGLGHTTACRSSTWPLILPPLRYEKLPSDYRAPFSLTLEHPAVSGPLTMASRTASSTLASLSRYFYHQRWIWSVQSGLAPAVPITAVAQLLSTLTE